MTSNSLTLSQSQPHKNFLCLAHRLLMFYLLSRIDSGQNDTLISFNAQKMHTFGSFKISPKSAKKKNFQPQSLCLIKSTICTKGTSIFSLNTQFGVSYPNLLLFLPKPAYLAQKKPKTPILPNSLTLSQPKPHKNFLCLAHRILMIYLKLWIVTGYN